MDDAELARRAHGNMVAAFAALPAHVVGGFVRRIGDVAVAATGSPSALFNEVIPLTDSASPDDLLEAVGTMRAAGLSSLVQLRNGAADALVPAAHGLGLEERTELSWPAMVCSPIPAVLDPPAGLTVHRATDPAGFEDHLHASAAIAGTTADRVRTWLGPGIVDDPAWALLTGHVDGNPVATSMSFHRDGMVGIYNVGTAEPARRRGYGWALTLAAIVVGAEAGCTVATLQSSAMAQPLYEAHGFRTLYRYRAFHDAQPSP